ncbi:MAG: DUF4339 domain-containing protein, partial [Planctomycetes bacterium]|nr:DUF4339 domain-containing protein [Planctomycetota bacterium]
MRPLQVVFRCPACRGRVHAPPKLEGCAARCPKCGDHVARWPAPLTALPPQPAPLPSTEHCRVCRAPVTTAGAVRCPKCGEPLTGPAAAPPPAPVPAAPAPAPVAAAPPPLPQAPAPVAVPPPLPAAVWHYVAGGARRGPVGWPQLQALARSGALRPEDLVWCEG